MSDRSQKDEPGPSSRTRQRTANKAPYREVSDSSDSEFEPTPPSKKAKKPVRNDNDVRSKTTESGNGKSKLSASNRSNPVKGKSTPFKNESTTSTRHTPVSTAKQFKEKEQDQGLVWGLRPRDAAAQSNFAFKVRSQNVVNFLDSLSRGIKTSIQLVNSPKASLVSYIKKFQVYKAASPFDRRVTALTWHPTIPQVLAVASKGGDIILWNYEQPKHSHSIQGQGPGGSVQTMTFDPDKRNVLYVVAIDGELSVKDMERNTSEAYLETQDWNHWYTALDVSFANRTIVAGDNNGYVNLLTTEGSPVWKLRLHRSKVLHAEFNQKESWLLATSSTDSTVKLWDIRMINNKTSALFELRHSKPINAANFSLCNGSRLLTTDQHSELRVYSGPLWQLETQIAHPHRQFQHLTPIKAYWHPLEDIVLVGRYPDPKMPGYSPAEQRSVDFFRASDGKLLCQLLPASVSGILSLNRFNAMGDALASGMGFNILVWKPKFVDRFDQIEEEDKVVESKKSGKERFKVPKKDDDDLKKKKTRKCSTKTAFK